MTATTPEVAYARPHLTITSTTRTSPTASHARPTAAAVWQVSILASPTVVTTIGPARTASTARSTASPQASLGRSLGGPHLHPAAAPAEHPSRPRRLPRRLQAIPAFPACSEFCGGRMGTSLNHEDTLQRLRSEGGGGTSPLSRSGIPIAHDRRPPIDLLCSLFPYKRSMLQQILDSCNNDITQALEQVLSLYGDQRGLGGSLVAGGGGGAVVTGSAASAASGGPCAGGLPGSHPPVPSSLTSPASLFGQTYLTAPLGSASHAIKSAFSPITVPPTAHLNSIRYTYGAAAAAAAAASGRSMALMPFHTCCRA
ncbi:hypothetical protein C0Q70_16829 [Pomacea canaliculata]|uniref:DMA domain-containing protein n=1 Tax=Pomacea canaliculata TaxID=400727 RepID=A0A2T7NQV7_POMCA|nr:hypothetical protein C0Q70_16829 [Pomacea canaliculata]